MFLLEGISYLRWYGFMYTLQMIVTNFNYIKPMQLTCDTFQLHQPDFLHYTVFPFGVGEG